MDSRTEDREEGRELKRVDFAIILLGISAPAWTPFALVLAGQVGHRFFGTQGWMFLVGLLLFAGGVAFSIWGLLKSEGLAKSWLTATLWVICVAAWLMSAPISYILFFLFATDGG